MQNFKKKEKELFKIFKLYSRKIISIIKKTIIAIILFLKKEYSLLIVSHSSDKTKSINITMFMMLSIIVLFVISIGSFVFLQSKIEFLSIQSKIQKSAILDIKKDYSILSEKVSHLLKISKPFQDASNNLIGRFNITDVTYPKDLEFFDPIYDISSFTSFLEESIQPLNEIHKIIKLESFLIDQIPYLWPIKRGVGYVSMYFGTNYHPFFNILYFHNGIDISVNGRTGDRVISTASGIVIETGHNLSYGNFITIEHGNNFVTRYAHLNHILVKKGQIVSRGQDIGILGNTGLSTGPHLHYEIIINQKYVNPLDYMIMRN